MANRSEAERAGRGYLRQPEVLWEAERSAESAGGATEVGSRGSAWERMLELLTSEDGGGALDDGRGSLRASIAERLHTRGESPTNDDGSSIRPVRRRRR